ncbi:uncharacterized protein LOC122310315 [Carya illinoinensis]|uniref:uncharacterized protein LOC122310315 n=1 Tax=Carya illinoinensis TaxID=32201 RepID=UPI001C7247FF|nr:uncharacterized protein LOC122310315 [Carya illinoinensis]
MGGKIWVFWIDELTFEVHGMSDQMISGCLSKGADSINVVFVYAKCNPVERRLLWQDMEAMRDDRTPLVVVGDFNIIREDRERIGGNPRSLSAMSECNSCMHNCGLVEMTGYGGRMSWCNGYRGPSRSCARLDRAFLNLALSQRFPNGCMEYLKRKTSDHCPMLIKLAVESQRYGPAPFWFQSMWCTHENFLQCVEGVWREPVAGTGLVCLAAKLKKLKPVLRKWNQEIFGRVDQSIKELEAKVELLEMRLQEGHIAKLEHEYMQTKAELERWENREEIRLSQQAKKRWITDGDRNSKFYHVVVNQRRKASAVSRMTLRSPGPDGFGSEFYMHCWPIVKWDVLEAARDFFQGTPLPRFYSASYIVLIPKMQDPHNFDKLGRLACEVLTRMLKQNFNHGRISPYYIPRGAPLVSHLLYADDLLIFANGGKKSVRGIIRTLEQYAQWSSQAINKEKSALFMSKRIPYDRRCGLLNKTGFTEGSFPTIYLGVPLVTGRLTARHLEPLVNKVRNKVASWKVKTLSQAGRLTLIKHMLSCMATHLLAVLNVPQILLSKLNSILSTFF